MMYEEVEGLLDLWGRELLHMGFRETRHRLFVKYVEREPIMVDLRGSYSIPIHKDLAAWIHPAHSDRFMPPDRTRRIEIVAKMLDDLEVPIPYRYTFHAYEEGRPVFKDVRFPRWDLGY